MTVDVIRKPDLGTILHVVVITALIWPFCRPISLSVHVVYNIFKFLASSPKTLFQLKPKLGGMFIGIRMVLYHVYRVFVPIGKHSKQWQKQVIPLTTVPKGVFSVGFSTCRWRIYFSTNIDDLFSCPYENFFMYMFKENIVC